MSPRPIICIALLVSAKSSQSRLIQTRLMLSTFFSLHNHDPYAESKLPHEAIDHSNAPLTEARLRKVPENQGSRWGKGDGGC